MGSETHPEKPVLQHANHNMTRHAPFPQTRERLPVPKKGITLGGVKWPLWKSSQEGGGEAALTTGASPKRCVYTKVLVSQNDTAGRVKII